MMYDQQAGNALARWRQRTSISGPEPTVLVALDLTDLRALLAVKAVLLHEHAPVDVGERIDLLLAEAADLEPRLANPMNRRPRG